MKFRIQGTFKQRTRIKLWFISIVTGWKTTPIDYSWEGSVSYQPFKDIPLAVKATGNTVSLTFVNVDIYSKTFKVNEPIHWEPIKGCIIDATVTVA